MDAWERTTDTSIDQFAIFIKLLADEGLIDQAVQHLKSKGYDKIRISVEHIREVQEMMKIHFGQNPSPKAQAVILSSHNNSHC